jgi:hypothetical protein
MHAAIRHCLIKLKVAIPRSNCQGITKPSCRESITKQRNRERERERAEKRIE